MPGLKVMPDHTKPSKAAHASDPHPAGGDTETDNEAEATLAKAEKLLTDEPDASGPRKPDFDHLPNSREIEKARKDKFGKKPGTARVDVDPQTGATTIRYYDRDGNEVK